MKANFRHLSSNSSFFYDSKEEKAAEIFKLLKAKNFGILLDDMWERLNLFEVGIPNLNDQTKSKVVLTTRSEQNAKDCHLPSSSSGYQWLAGKLLENGSNNTSVEELSSEVFRLKSFGISESSIHEYKKGTYKAEELDKIEMFNMILYTGRDIKEYEEGHVKLSTEAVEVHTTSSDEHVSRFEGGGAATFDFVKIELASI
ncbi:hypothetical protein CK203_109565 [Vitis vinifera]|uniref:NB-ARC domain-containing protein n=1 Tax=Vitis vinifera TaxID=29760 RepID=A0A438CF02_VITVI|nr:hypothetical protein CK203_109565 [Vitis vinifera]